MLHLLTKADEETVAGPEKYLKARNFAQGVLQRIDTPTGPLSGPQGLASNEGRADLPHIALSEIYKLQSLYLTSGALAMQAGEPEVAFVDYARGIEVVMRFARAVSPPGTLRSTIATNSFHSLRELFDAINFHVQFIYLKTSAAKPEFIECKRALLEVTAGAYNLEGIRRDTLKYVRLSQYRLVYYVDRLCTFQLSQTLSKAIGVPSHTFPHSGIYASLTFASGESPYLGQTTFHRC